MPQIRLQLRPNGPSCNHVIIRNENSARILLVRTIPELREPINPKGDNHLMTQIKRIARNSGISDPALIKTHLEAQEFEY